MFNVATQTGMVSTSQIPTGGATAVVLWEPLGTDRFTGVNVGPVATCELPILLITHNNVLHNVLTIAYDWGDIVKTIMEV